MAKKLSKVQPRDNVVAFPTRHKVRPMPPKPENAFADAIVRLAPLLRDYDREELFKVLYRLNIRDLRERMYSCGVAGLDPDEFFGGIDEKRRGEIEKLTRQQLESLNV